MAKPASKIASWGVWAVLCAAAACSSSSNPSNPGGGLPDASAVDSGHPVEAGKDASEAAAPAPLDCNADDADWPMFGHDVCNTRGSTTAGGISTTTAAKLATKWTYAAQGEISATPAVVAGQVYVPDWAGFMTRLDGATGNVVWSKSVADLAGLTADGGSPPDPVVARATPVVSGQALIFGLSRVGFSSSVPLAWMVAVDKDTGALLWTTQLDDHPYAVLTSSPALDGTTLYVGISSLEEVSGLVNPSYKCCTFRGGVAALDATSGKLLWKTPTIDDATYFGPDGTTPSGWAGAAVWSGTPTVDRQRKTLYVTTGNNYASPTGVTTVPAGNHLESILALDAATGAIKWSQRMTMGDVFTLSNESEGPDYDFGCGANLMRVAGDGGTQDLVGAGQKSGTYWAVDADTGAVVWHTSVGPGGHLGGIHWGTAYDGARIYVGVNDTNATSYALAGSGSQAGQKVSTGSWAALDPATGKILWQVKNPTLDAPLGGASVNAPITALGGVVFAGSMDASGTMFALDASSGATLWSFQAGGTVYGGPAVSGGVVYWGAGYLASRLGFGTSAKKLYAFAAP
jgi:polyvinyl alcohol dehydrogenase (cytochrome)